MPIKMPLRDRANIVEVMAGLDEIYFRAINGDQKPHGRDFMDPKIKSVMQLLWNPHTGHFYDDVGVECRTPPPVSQDTPVEKDWSLPLPEDAWIVLTPDSGC